MTATPSPIPAFLREVAGRLEQHGYRVDTRPGPRLLWAAPGSVHLQSMVVIPYALGYPVLRAHVNRYEVTRGGAARVRLGLPRDAPQASAPRLEVTVMPEELQALVPWLADTIVQGVAERPCPVALSPGSMREYVWTRAALEALDLPAAPASPQPASVTLAEIRRGANSTVRLTREHHDSRPYLRLSVAAENQAERTVSLRVQEAAALISGLAMAMSLALHGDAS